MVSKGAKKRRIMLGAYLSHTQMQTYLDLLQKRGLLNHHEQSRVYTLSEKGVLFLQAYESMETLTGIDQPGRRLQIQRPAVGEAIAEADAGAD
jgi:predicted transcriptional regulator